MWYNLMKLNGAKILELGKFSHEKQQYIYKFDLNNDKDNAELIISVDRHTDCALFDQIRFAMGRKDKDSRKDKEVDILKDGLSYTMSDSVRSAMQKDTDTENTQKEKEEKIQKVKEEEILKNRLLYLDFGEIYTSKYKNNISDQQKRFEDLLEYGFDLTINGSDKAIHYHVFDKSAGMARNCRITFIDEDLFESVDERIRLGIDFSEKSGIDWNLNLSKYYAYRGLYMTDGTRVDPETITLNESTVIVIPDKDNELKDQPIITVDGENDENGEFVFTEILCEKQDVTITNFDGEGFVSPEYADLFNAALRKRNADKKAATFQIRMPFTKGILHCVNFAEFIKEYLPDESYEELEITDAFGIRRKLADVRIVLTESMFKCCKWLKVLQKNSGEELPDPMKFYFEQFHTYNHALYIGNTDLNILDTGKIKLNYQFLNTLGFDSKTLEQKVKDHFDDAHAVRENLSLALQQLLGPGEWSDDDPDSQETITDSGKFQESWKYALTVNPAFINERKIKDKLRDTEKSLARDAAFGQIRVTGFLRYLSDDLLMLLLHMVECLTIEGGEKKTALEKKKYVLIENLGKKALQPDKFYMAGSRELRFYENRYYGILRSPHLSRNEQCAASPYIPEENEGEDVDEKENIYQKYFAHLKGVLMVPSDSYIPMALAGADFDGDYVKVIEDKDVNDAIVSNVYQIMDESDENGRSRKSIRRKMGIALIPGRGASGVQGVPEHISYEMLKATFSNRVGQISNLAIQIGKKEYWKGEDVQLTDIAMVGKEENTTCALCTIATGLEIDAVKSGVRPNLKALETCVSKDKEKGKGKKKKDYFLDAIEKLKDPEQAVSSGYQLDSFFHNQFIKFDYDKGKDTYIARYGADNKQLFKASLKNVSGNDDPVGIDLLLYYYLKDGWDSTYYIKDNTKHRKRHGDIKDEKLPEYMFKFEEDSDWKSNLDKEKEDQLKKTIGAYKKLNSEVSWIKFFMHRLKKEDQAVHAIIWNILGMEYDFYEDKLPQSKMEILDAIKNMYEELDGRIKDVKAVEAVQQRAMENWDEWSLTFDFEKKKELLYTILDVEKLSLSTEEILCDVYEQGYMILWYTLSLLKNTKKQVKTKKKLVSVEELQEDEGKEWTKPYDKKLYDKIYDKYSEYERDSSKSLWIDEVREICREDAIKLYNGDVSEAVKAVYAVSDSDGLDASHTFFWDVFHPQDIEKVIYKEKDSVTE